MGSVWGQLFKLSTFGESHGPAVGGVIDGCPPGFSLSVEGIQTELDRRRPGATGISTQRKEADKVEFLSGLEEGVTLGTPIGFVVRNKDQKSKDYSHLEKVFRPSHADYTYQAKYGLRAVTGGGRASARETVARVVGGAVARQILAARFGIEIVGCVTSVHTLKVDLASTQLNRDVIEGNDVRCPDPKLAEQMVSRIKEARKNGDSLGGIVYAEARHVPVGWGDPVFDRLEADLAKAMLSLPASKGFEVGSGFAGTEMTGQSHNDAFTHDGERIVTRTNNSGGVQGGISNGAPITIRVAFKPTATIMRTQDTVDADGNATQVEGKGRHDPCVVPRAVPIVEAMFAMVLIDAAMRQEALVAGGKTRL